MRRRASSYRALATLLDGGIPIAQALDRLRPGPGSPAAAETVRSTRDGALAALLGAPPHEAAAITAAERTGELTATLRQLADDLDASLAARRDALSRCAYPLFVLHLIVPATTTVDLIRAPSRYFGRVALATGLLWAAIVAGAALCAWLVRTPRAVTALARLPLVGPPLVRSAQARWLRLFATLHGAGVKAIEALKTAESALGAAPPSEEYADVAARALRGESLESALAALVGLEPEERSELIAAAAVGDLERALRRVAGRVVERWRSAMQRLARVAGGSAYFLAVVLVGAAAVRFYSDYFAQFSRPH